MKATLLALSGAALLGSGACQSHPAVRPLRLGSEPSEAVVSEQRRQVSAFSSRWSEFDHDNDGGLNLQEWRNYNWAVYLLGDYNRDGHIDFTEYAVSNCGLSGSNTEFYNNCRRFHDVRFRKISNNGLFINNMDVNSWFDDQFKVNDRDHNMIISAQESAAVQSELP